MIKNGREITLSNEALHIGWKYQGYPSKKNKIMKKIEHSLKLLIILGMVAGMGALVYGFFSESIILGVLFVTVIIGLIWLMVTKDSTEM